MEEILAAGGVGVMPTDTIYGVVGSALRKSTVRRIYALRKRNPKKPAIILIGDMGDLARFGIAPDLRTKKILKKIWPGKVSVIFPLNARRPRLAAKLKYLHRGTRTLAFRLPKPKRLRTFLRQTGPLIAPSANPEGKLPAKTIRAARRYFGNKVDFYVDGGRKDAKPSTLVSIKKGGVIVLREGAVKIGKSVI